MTVTSTARVENPGAALRGAARPQRSAPCRN